MLRPVLRASGASMVALAGAVVFLYLLEAALLGTGWHPSPAVAWMVAITGWVSVVAVTVWAAVWAFRTTDTTNLRRSVKWVAIAVVAVEVVVIAAFLLVALLVSTGAITAIRAV